MKIVSADDDGIRPAGPPDACFYCGQKVGAPHREDCVTVKTKRRVRLTVEYEIDAPLSWTPEQIEFHRNESSWCASNALAELEALYGHEAPECGCSAMSFDVWDWERGVWV